MSTVPRSLGPAVLTFCAEISAAKPIYIRSKPSADAQMSACFDNVARKVARAGGAICYGWAIWHVAGLYFEAEHHGVWKNRQGALLDVSPQLGAVPKIVFLPDPEAVYDAKRFRPNILKAVDGSRLGQEFVRLSLERNAIVNRYRTNEYVLAMFNRTDQSAIGNIDGRLRAIWTAHHG